MARGLAELCSEKCLEDIPGCKRSNGAAAQADNIHVIVLYTLARGEVILYKSGADTGYFIRAHGRSDAATADGHTTLDPASRHRPRQRNDKVRIVVLCIQKIRAEIHNLVAGSAKLSGQLFL
jgi:hypothetical protein